MKKAYNPVIPGMGEKDLIPGILKLSGVVPIILPN
jgi:hypothetical protein